MVKMKFSIKNFKLGNVFRNVSSKVKTGNVNKLVDGIKKVNKSFDQASRSLNASKEYNFNGIETIPYSDTKDSNSGSSSVNATGPTTAVIAVYNECINLIKSNKSFDINNVNDNSSRKCTFLCEQNAPGLKKKLKKYINDNYGKTWHASILNDNVIKALVNLNKNMINSNNTIRELNGRAASVPSSKLSEEDEKKSEENSFAGMQTPLEAYKNMLEKQRKESPPSPPVRTKKKSDETLQHHAEVDARHTSVKSDFNSHTDATNGSTELNGSDKNANKLSSKALPGQNKTAEPVKVSQHHAEGGAEHTSATSGKRDFKSPSSATNDFVDLSDLDKLADGLETEVLSEQKQTTKLTEEELNALDEVTGTPKNESKLSNTSKTEKAPALSGNGGVHAAPAGKKDVTPKQATNPKQTTNHTTAAPAEKNGTAPRQSVHVGTTGGAGMFKNFAKVHNETITNKSGARALPNRGATLPQQHHRPLSYFSQEKEKSATLNHVPITNSEKEKKLTDNFEKMADSIKKINDIEDIKKEIHSKKICGQLETTHNQMRGTAPCAVDKQMRDLCTDISQTLGCYEKYAKRLGNINIYEALEAFISNFKKGRNVTKEWAAIPKSARDLVDGLIELYKNISPLDLSKEEKILLENFKKATEKINNINNIKGKFEDLKAVHNLVCKDIMSYNVNKSTKDLYNDIAKIVSYYMEYANLDDSTPFNNYETLGRFIKNFEDTRSTIPKHAQGLVGGLIELYKKIPTPLSARRPATQTRNRAPAPPPVPDRSAVASAPPLPKRGAARQQPNHASGPNGSIQTGTRARMPLPTQGRVLPPNPSPSSVEEATRQTSSGQVTPPVDVSSVSAPQTPSAPAAPQTRPPVAPAPQTSSTPAAPPAPSTPETPSSVNSNSEIPPAPPAPQAPQAPAAPSAPPAPPAPSAPAAQMSSTPGSTSTLADEINEKKATLRKTPPKDNSVGANTDTAVTDMTTLLRNALKGRHVAMQDSEEPETDSDEWTD